MVIGSDNLSRNWIVLGFLVVVVAIPIIIALVIKRVKFNRKRAFIDEIIEVLHQRLRCPIQRTYKLTSETKLLLEKENFNAKSIYTTVMEVFRYLDVPNENIRVSVNVVADELVHNVGIGLYVAGQERSDMHMIFKQSYSANQIMMILCHMCVTHYLRIKNTVTLDDIRYLVNRDDVREYEITLFMNRFVSLAAMYLGFGDYYERGYYGLADSPYGLAPIQLGYIDSYKSVNRYLIKRIKALRF